MSNTPGLSFVCRELGDSPRFRINEQGLSCTRKFRLPWGKWEVLAAALMGVHRDPDGSGDASKIDYTQRYALPGYPNCFASEVDVGPYQPESPDAQAGADLLNVNGSGTMNTYTGGDAAGGGAVLIAQYQTLFSADITKVHPQMGSALAAKIRSKCPGTYLSYDRELGGQIMTTPPASFKWYGTSTRVEIPIGLVIPEGTHKITWFWIIAPPWTAIENTIGKVNSATFLGYEAGRLLFLGCQPIPCFRFQSGLNDQTIYYKLGYLFSSVTKFLRDNSTKVGFNHFFRKVASGQESWQKIVNDDGVTPYLEADFDNLFAYGT